MSRIVSLLAKRGFRGTKLIGKWLLKWTSECESFFSQRALPTSDTAIDLKLAQY